MFAYLCINCYNFSVKFQNLLFIFVLFFSVLFCTAKIELLKDTNFKNGMNLFAPTFGKKSLHDGKGVTFSGNLMPFFKKGLNIARKKGFLKHSPNDNDFAISSVILGWEVPGINNVLMQVCNLSLKIFPKSKK